MAEKLAYEDDARIKRLRELINDYRKALKKLSYKNTLKKDEEAQLTQALKDLHSIGTQLNGVYLDQLPLVPDVPARKVVQQR